VSEGYQEGPVRGLPGRLPDGEHVVWQGAPEWKRLALDAFHVRGISAYFGLLMLWALIVGSGLSGMMITLAAAGAAVALLCGLAWLISRSTVYTLTNKRIVLRMGVALPKCINIPLVIIGNAAMKRNRDGSGDIPLALIGPDRMGYAMLWPHARPWKVANPEPMLRALPDVEAVSALIARTLAEAVPDGRRVPLADSSKGETPDAEAIAA
jgi:hypothetical protein